MEPGIGWERGEGWLKIVALTEAARQRDWSEWTPERRERIFQRVLVGLLLRLIGVDVVALALARG